MTATPPVTASKVVMMPSAPSRLPAANSPAVTGRERSSANVRFARSRATLR